MDVGDTVPVCGACIIAVEIYRAQTKSLRVLHGEPVETELDALASLRGTRWPTPAVDRLAANFEAIEFHYPVLSESDRADYLRYSRERANENA